MTTSANGRPHSKPRAAARSKLGPPLLLEVRFCASFYCLPFLIFDCLHGSLFFFFFWGGAVSCYRKVDIADGQRCAVVSFKARLIRKFSRRRRRSPMQALVCRLGPEKKREPCEIKVADFDDVLYKVLVMPENLNIITLNVALRDWANLKKNGAQSALDEAFPGCETKAEEGFDLAIVVNADR